MAIESNAQDAKQAIASLNSNVVQLSTRVNAALDVVPQIAATMKQDLVNALVPLKNENDAQFAVMKELANELHKQGNYQVASLQVRKN